MNKKLALVAASVIAISAYAHADAQEVETEEKGMLETLLSDEQPPLEGDSPLVDEEATVATEGDDALVGEPYAGDDVEALPAAPEFADETDPLATPDTDVLTAQELPDADVEQEDPAFADTDPMVADDPMMGEEPELATEADADGYLNDADRTAMTPGGAIDAAPMADSGTMDETDADAMPTTADAAPMDDADVADDAMMTADAEPSEPLPAPDAKIAAVPTDPTEAVAEAALIAGTYEVTIPNRQGTSTLFIEGRGTEAAGTFDGQPIDVIVTGRNFSFDAPVEMNGEEQLMTFAGTAEDGVIDNGVIEAQGDGGYLTFDARRVDAASTDAMSGDTDMDSGDMDSEAFGSDVDAMGADAMSDGAMSTDTEADTDEAETGFGTTGSDVLDDAGDDAGFGETYDDATGFGTEEDAGIDTMDADTDIMGGSDAMDTDSASDALTTDGGLEGNADDMSADDMGADRTMSDEPMMDEPVMDDADAEFGTDSDADAATEGDVTEDDLDDAGDPNFEF